MESDKISKCCCDLDLKYKKRQVIVSLRVITKVFLLRHSNVSLENRKKPLTSSAERKSCKCQVKCKLNRASPVPPHKKN